ncbi:mechanosensitive ion channel family protein [Pseudohalioglobus lutimaris]|uniref:Mechanosensitive ion channel protein MscS n=1 Tax=Pseudohalioglobus lutimaris TaxID=1737061 RepID=A0A2N5X3Q3_9GAMM|nr:mechanosensitive ion channel domain-containing protein [Pseudohalioglobus lutimaris]PLW69092.1 mechanosensitive ion channel protein MscS [Pseudohalioglobus lutimaris]
MLRALIILSLLLPWMAVSVARAQPSPEQPDLSARDLIEAEKQTAQLVEQRESTDPNAMRDQATPLTAMLGLRTAMRSQDHESLGNFLDRRYIDDEIAEYSDEELLKALAYVFGRQNIIELTTLSDDPEGRLDDGLPNYRDQIGAVQLTSETIPIYLQRVPDGKGGRVWKLSNATVARIPDMWEELGYSDTAVKLSRWLPEFRFMGMENWQVAGLVLFFLLAWPVASIITYLLMRLALLIPNRFPLGIQHFFRRPMRFFVFIVIARLLIDHLGLSMTASILLESSGIDYVAFTVLFMGVLSLLRDYQIRKMQHAGNTHYVALLKPFTTILKILVITIIALYWAKQAGYDMSTILAGLGVGSLAVALAAQKTLENVIGAITLYTARPVSAGDLCRFGDVTGIVEEIGLRSTIIRTLDRSMVVIPNSVFSSVEIENYSERDRIRFYRRYRIQVPSADQMRSILEDVRALLLGHEQVMEDTVSVRFEDIIDANAILRVDAGVATTNFQDFLAVAEDLNLGMLDIVDRAGARFTGPAQLHQEPMPPAAEGKGKAE